MEPTPAPTLNLNQAPTPQPTCDTTPAPTVGTDEPIVFLTSAITDFPTTSPTITCVPDIQSTTTYNVTITTTRTISDGYMSDAFVSADRSLDKVPCEPQVISVSVLSRDRRR